MAPPSVLNLASARAVIGLPPSDPTVTSFLLLCASLAPSTSSSLVPVTLPEPEIKSYPDAIYHNYYTLGISLCYLPAALGSSPVLDAIDIFNPTATPAPTPNPTTTRRRVQTTPTYAPHPPLQLTFPTAEITLPPAKPGSEPTVLSRDLTLLLTPQTTGRDLVRALGEPSRKGGGSGWVGLWLEWKDVVVRLDSGDEGGGGEEGDGEVVKVGLMVELRDPKGEAKLTEEEKKKGAGGVWERAAGWEWASIKVFA